MELFKRVYQNLQERRDKILNGGINCVPFGLPRFEEELPGIEQGKMICVTANAKVGKTQVADYLYLFKPVFYAMQHPDKMRVKVFYFSLEMSKEEKYRQLMCHLLYYISKGKIRIDPKTLSSTANALPEEVLEILSSEEYQQYFKFFEEHVEYIDSVKNPFGLYKLCREYAKAHGTQHTKFIDIEDNKTHEIKSTEVDDYYIADDPDEYVIILVDHLALLSPEKGGDIREAIIKFTSDYAISLRNKYHYIPVLIQQQAAAQESNDNLKLNKLKPTLDGLGEAKITQRDFNVILGLFSPFRHGLREYEGYDITKFKDNIRFLEIIASREGGGGTVCPLFFDGGVNFFRELPLPQDKQNMEIAYRMLERSQDKGRLFFMHGIKNKLKHFFNK